MPINERLSNADQPPSSLENGSNGGQIVLTPAGFTPLRQEDLSSKTSRRTTRLRISEVLLPAALAGSMVTTAGGVATLTAIEIFNSKQAEGDNNHTLVLPTLPPSPVVLMPFSEADQKSAPEPEPAVASLEKGTEIETLQLGMLRLEPPTIDSSLNLAALKVSGGKIIEEEVRVTPQPLELENAQEDLPVQPKGPVVYEAVLNRGLEIYLGSLINPEEAFFNPQSGDLNSSLLALAEGIRTASPQKAETVATILLNYFIAELAEGNFDLAQRLGLLSANLMPAENQLEIKESIKEILKIFETSRESSLSSNSQPATSEDLNQPAKDFEVKPASEPQTTSSPPPLPSLESKVDPSKPLSYPTPTAAQILGRLLQPLPERNRGSQQVVASQDRASQEMASPNTTFQEGTQPQKPQGDFSPEASSQAAVSPEPLPEPTEEMQVESEPQEETAEPKEIKTRLGAYWSPQVALRVVGDILKFVVTGDLPDRAAGGGRYMVVEVEDFLGLKLVTLQNQKGEIMNLILFYQQGADIQEGTFVDSSGSILEIVAPYLSAR